MGNESAISLQHVSKRYGGSKRWGNSLREELTYQWSRLAGKRDLLSKDIWALQDVNLEVAEGSILGLIGHNGAGKITLLKILASITAPSSGKVILRGRRTSILEIGTGFHPDLTGRQNIFLAGTVAGLPEKIIRQRLDEIIAFSGIAPFIDLPVKHFSSGMYLRLAFSVAFFANADILLLDEVLAVGDLDFRTKSAVRLREIAASGATIVLASHELSAVEDLCTQALILDHGKVIHEGRPKEILEQYLGSFYDHYRQPSHENDSSAVDFLDIEVCAVGKPTEADVTLEDAIKVTIRYRKCYDEGDLDIVLSISDYQHQLLSDCPIYRQAYTPQFQAAGVYVAKVVLPAHLLNEGSYYVHLIFGDKANALLSLAYLKKFRVNLTEWERDKKWNEGIMRTPLRPRLGWEIKAEK